jgi:lipid II isoglutaminyl synthase (glutamine-hydrolysing)
VAYQEKALRPLRAPTLKRFRSMSRARRRLVLAEAAGIGAATLSRLSGLGGGTTIGGRVALTFAPDALSALGRGRVGACVSGSNGKTTTTRLLAAALSPRHEVISNSSGANMPSGMVSALMGRRGGLAVLEVDELYLGTTMDAVTPQVAVLLNLTRDQLDRTAEIHRIAQSWRTALIRHDRSFVVANCDDPHVVWAIGDASRVTWVAAGQLWSGDGQGCPQCGHVLQYDPVLAPDRAGPAWRCRHCSLRRPTPDARLTVDGLRLKGGRTFPVDFPLPGEANQANAALAACAATKFGVSVPEALSAMAHVREIEGRYAERSICGRNVRLLLAKNPAGWAETLDILETNSRPLVLSMNAEAVDGRDTSWLYDVPFEVLAGRRVTVTGGAGADLALRLAYAGVEHDHVPGLREAVTAADAKDGRAAGAGPAMDVIGDYSSFQSLRRLAAKS